MSTHPGPDSAVTLPGHDLMLCEREAIHVPGAIQPHGALLGALSAGLVVTHASANLQAILVPYRSTLDTSCIKKSH